MEKNYLRYQLSGGYINHWLAMGPCDTPIDDRPTEGESTAAFRTRILQARASTAPEFGKPPLEIDKYSWRGDDFFWEAAHTQEDHVIDRSGFESALVYRRAWAFTCLSAPAPVDATFHVTLTCPATVWLNNKHVLHVEHPMDASGHIAQTYTYTARLKRGRNDLMVRMEQVAQGHIPMSVAVRVDKVSLDSTRVLVPTVTIEAARRQEWERAFEHAYLDRAVYYREEQVNLICRDDMPGFHQIVMRLQKLDGSIYAETYGEIKAKQVIESLIAMQLPTSEMRAVVMPPPGFYYERGFRPRRDIPFWTSNYHFYQQPEHAVDDRLIELMQEAVRCYDPLYAELAKMGFGWWELLEVPPVQKVIGRVKRHEAGTLADLLGLVIMHLRMGQYEKFPAALLPEIEECVFGYDYSDEAAPAGELNLECNQILLLAAHLLAAQIEAQATFTASGLTAKQERTRAERAAGAWLKQHGQTGFAQWNSHLDLVVAALSQLADLAKSETVSDLAAVLLDKTLFGIAINSFQGTFAASRGDAVPSILRSGRFAPEAGISRLGWGTGGYTPAFKGTVCLGLAGTSYELPEMIRSIAVDQPLWMITRERQALGGSEDVNTVAYKTPDFMLASAQDYRPGQRGKNEHIWQATLGPEALVFSNHPSCLIESDSRQAGRWCGNGSLPRVAQWKDALICLYNLPEDDWLGFTHAYFPEFAFDEHVREQGWAFARKGDGYLALHASPEMTFVDKGPDAYHELRAAGQQTVWLCQMGRAELDGTFEDFRKAVLSKNVNVHDLHVEWETVRGDKLDFSWSGPLLVNGEQQPITGFRHMESLYGVAEMPAEDMDIIFREQVMRLHFG